MDIQDWIVCSNPFCVVCCPWGHWRAKQQWVVPVFIHIKMWLYQLQPELFVGATLQSWHLSSGSTHSLPPPKCRCQPETPTPVSPKGRRVERDRPIEKNGGGGTRWEWGQVCYRDRKTDKNKWMLPPLDTASWKWKPTLNNSGSRGRPTLWLY